jgi:hypothetical protein
METSPWDLHHVEGVGIKDVESVAAIHEHLRGSHIAHDQALTMSENRPGQGTWLGWSP